MAEQESMPIAHASSKLALDDYLLFPDDGQRHELIDGVHYVSPSPLLRHQRISRRLLVEIELYLRRHPIGEVFCAPLTTILSNYDVVEPDILYVSNENRTVLQDWVRGVPDLVVEILSPTSRKIDEEIKRHLYERVGVLEYWIVDPILDTVTILRREGEQFGRPLVVTRSDGTLTTQALPEADIDLERLFA